MGAEPDRNTRIKKEQISLKTTIETNLFRYLIVFTNYITPTRNNFHSRRIVFFWTKKQQNGTYYQHFKILRKLEKDLKLKKIPPVELRISKFTSFNPDKKPCDEKLVEKEKQKKLVTDCTKKDTCSRADG